MTWDILNNTVKNNILSKGLGVDSYINSGINDYMVAVEDIYNTAKNYRTPDTNDPDGQ